MPTPELPVLPFASPALFRAWLKKHHAASPGIWLHFYKKDSGIKTITYAQALDEALCYGWIDSQVKRVDASSYVQRYSPRRPRSLWSKRNREHIARLVEEKRMMPAGLKEVDAAKADGRWDQAYDSPKNMEVPADLLQALAKDKKALAFFKTLNKTNTYAIVWRLQTAKKAETRERRLKAILEMLSEGKAIHFFEPKKKTTERRIT